MLQSLLIDPLKKFKELGNYFPGDHWYKRNDSLLPQEQMISAWPDIQNETIGELDEFMVIACDGIWYVP